MLYRLVAPPSVETRSDNVMRLYVRDALGIPVANAHVRVWAGPPPSGTPSYFLDELPFRLTNSSGLLEYYAFDGAMPDTRDYWMQVQGHDGMVQGDPIQFHFGQGAMDWITATVQAEEESLPLTPEPAPVQWDVRLDPMHVSVSSVGQVARGQYYWKLIAAQYQDEKQSGGNHHLYYKVMDEDGHPVSGVPIHLDWEGREPADIPAQSHTDLEGNANFGLYGGPVGWNPNIQPGPYTGWVGDPDLLGVNATGIPGERLVGIGLPMNRHVNFTVTWRKVAAGALATGSSIHGVVSNAPAGTLVMLSGTETKSATPDRSGEYAFKGLSAGTYAISITGVGSVRSGIALDGSNSVQVNYSFSAAPGRESRVLGNIRNAEPNTQLSLSSSDQTFTAKVDSLGNYAFTGLPAGTFSLSIIGVGTISWTIVLDGSNTVTFNYTVQPPPAGKLIAHYLLLGPPNHPTTRTTLILALDYIACFGPAVGFSVEEAKAARNVTIVGSQTISAAEEQALVTAGCRVRHLGGADGYALQQQFSALVASENPYSG